MACKNRSTIESTHLSGTQIDRALMAAEQAKKIGRNFTHFLTVHWENTDGFSGTVQDNHQDFLVRARHWLKRRNVPLVCLWSIEPDKIGKGLHSHTLIHLPRDCVKGFAEMLLTWTNTQALDLKTAKWERKKLPKGAVSCGGYADTPWSPTWLLQRRYNASPRLAGYLLKADPYQSKHHGRVIGKRLGYSNSIGPASWLKTPEQLPAL
jgi:hypothetical protein